MLYVILILIIIISFWISYKLWDIHKMTDHNYKESFLDYLNRTGGGSPPPPVV